MEVLRDKNGLTEAEFLAQYRPKDYERPSVTADIVIFKKTYEGLKLLLIKRGGHPYLGCYALPGGFAEKNETIMGSAMRELREETGLKGLPLEEVGLFSGPNRDPRTWVMSDAFVSVVREDLEVKAGDDAKEAKWFDVKITENEDDEVTFTFTHEEEVLKTTVQRVYRQGIKKVIPEYIPIKSDLAFDHAVIIAYSYHQVELCL